MTDLEDSQRPNGSIPDVSPNYWPLYNDDLTWPGTIVFVHGMLYDQYGDKRVLAPRLSGDEEVDGLRADLRQGRPDLQRPVRRLVRAARGSQADSLQGSGARHR